MPSLPPGAALASTVTSVCLEIILFNDLVCSLHDVKVAALGFVPVAVHFNLFDILAEIEGPATGEDVLAAYRSSKGNKAENDVPCVCLMFSPP